MAHPKKYVDTLQMFTEKTWLFEEIFWEKWLVLHDTPKEKVKSVLYNAYDLNDVYDIFEPELDQEKLSDIMRILFAYPDTVITQPDYLQSLTEWKK